MPDSILVQLDESDMSDESKVRLEAFTPQTDLPIELLRRHSGFEPGNLLALAKSLKVASARERAALSWTGYPNRAGLEAVCVLSRTD